MNNKENEMKPDRKITLAEIPDTSFVKRIAAAMIARHGSYTYTEPSGVKVLVTK